MSAFQSNTALILVDLINEMVDPKGKLAGKGYADFIQRHGSLERAAQLLAMARRSNFAVIHIRVGFSPDYKEQPESSPLFGGAKKFGALTLNTWATEFHELVQPKESEAILVKHRVSGFHGTSLETVLRSYGARDVLIAGCATDMAVQALARDAHDRDFAATVVADCCVAANDLDHEQTLRMIVKVARVVDLNLLS